MVTQKAQITQKDLWFMVVSEHEGHEINGSILVVEEKEELSDSLIN